MPYLCGLWRFANAYQWEEKKGEAQRIKHGWLVYQRVNGDTKVMTTELKDIHDTYANHKVSFGEMLKIIDGKKE